jgi:hypothetical protein
MGGIRSCSTWRYIDALDEIDGTGGSDFLTSLTLSTKVMKNASAVFVTSRSDQGLVAHVNSLERKHLYCLQDVKEEEASGLNTSVAEVLQGPLLGAFEFSVCDFPLPLTAASSSL